MRTTYQKLQILTLIFSASVLLSAVIRGGEVFKTDPMQCPAAPNGRLYYGPGC